MTQAQIDPQTQLEQTSFDPTTYPIFNDSPVLFLKTLDQTNTNNANVIEQAALRRQTGNFVFLKN